jgi:hypothetical protein
MRGLHEVLGFRVRLLTQELLGQVLALFFVAAFGSSLDVAAIQSESPEPLDFNHELQTVGVSARPGCFTGLPCLLLLFASMECA